MDALIVVMDKKELELSRSPWSFYGIDPPYRNHHFYISCSNCNRKEEKRHTFKTCLRCKQIGVQKWESLYHYYCSRECQKTHWKKHRIEHEKYEKREAAKIEGRLKPKFEKTENRVKSESSSSALDDSKTNITRTSKIVTAKSIGHEEVETQNKTDCDKLHCNSRLEVESDLHSSILVSGQGQLQGQVVCSSSMSDQDQTWDVSTDHPSADVQCSRANKGQITQDSSYPETSTLQSVQGQTNNIPTSGENVESPEKLNAPILPLAVVGLLAAAFKSSTKSTHQPDPSWMPDVSTNLDMDNFNVDENTVTGTGVSVDPRTEVKPSPAHAENIGSITKGESAIPRSKLLSCEEVIEPLDGNVETKPKPSEMQRNSLEALTLNDPYSKMGRPPSTSATSLPPLVEYTMSSRSSPPDIMSSMTKFRVLNSDKEFGDIFSADSISQISDEPSLDVTEFFRPPSD